MTRLGDDTVWAGTSDFMVHSLSNYLFFSTNRITNGTTRPVNWFFLYIQTHVFSGKTAGARFYYRTDSW